MSYFGNPLTTESSLQCPPFSHNPLPRWQSRPSRAPTRPLGLNLDPVSTWSAPRRSPSRCPSPSPRLLKTRWAAWWACGPAPAPTGSTTRWTNTWSWRAADPASIFIVCTLVQAPTDWAEKHLFWLRASLLGSRGFGQYSGSAALWHF